MMSDGDDDRRELVGLKRKLRIFEIRALVVGI